MFLAIAVPLMVIAALLFARGVQELALAPTSEPFAVTMTRAVNSALFISVVLELDVTAATSHGDVRGPRGHGCWATTS
jgi:hypothetical protein